MKINLRTIFTCIGCMAISSVFYGFYVVRPIKIKSQQNFPVKMAEPSDAVLSSSGNTYFVVSDNGFFAEVNFDGTVIRKTKEMGMDFEGITLRNGKLYLMDESLRQVKIFDEQTFQLEKTISLKYSGARNKGFEAITYNESKGCFIAVTEKEAVQVFEFDDNFQYKGEVKFDKSVRDVSSATWYKGELWFLSDEDRLVMKVDPTTYAIKEKYQVSIINPESIVFRNDGKMVLISDDMQRSYIYDQPKQ